MSVKPREAKQAEPSTYPTLSLWMSHDQLLPVPAIMAAVTDYTLILRASHLFPAYIAFVVYLVLAMSDPQRLDFGGGHFCGPFYPV